MVEYLPLNNFDILLRQTSRLRAKTDKSEVELLINDCHAQGEAQSAGYRTGAAPSWSRFGSFSGAALSAFLDCGRHFLHRDLDAECWHRLGNDLLDSFTHDGEPRPGRYQSSRFPGCPPCGCAGRYGGPPPNAARVPKLDGSRGSHSGRPRDDALRQSLDPAHIYIPAR